MQSACWLVCGTMYTKCMRKQNRWVGGNLEQTQTERLSSALCLFPVKLSHILIAIFICCLFNCHGGFLLSEPSKLLLIGLNFNLQHFFLTKNEAQFYFHHFTFKTRVKLLHCWCFRKYGQQNIFVWAWWQRQKGKKKDFSECPTCE